jgi:hypothetical protein
VAPTIGAVVLRVQDVDRMVAFWSAALDPVPREDAEGDWVSLRSRAVDCNLLEDPEGNRFDVADRPTG